MDVERHANELCANDLAANAMNCERSIEGVELRVEDVRKVLS